MKPLLLLLTLVLLAPLARAQDTNAFTMPATNLVVDPAVTVTNPTISLIAFNVRTKQITIYFVGVADPTVISGAAAQQFLATLKPTVQAALAAYLSGTNTGTNSP